MSQFYKDIIKSKWQAPGFQRYFKNTGWLLFSRVLCMIISFVTTAIIARHLGPTNYGQLSYALSFISIFSFLASLGIDSVLYRDLIKFPEKKEIYLGSALAIKLGASVLTSIVTIILAIFIAEDDVSKLLIFILSTTFIFSSFNLISNDFQSRVESKYPAIISFIVILILNVSKIIVILFDKGVIYLSFIVLLEPILFSTFYIYAYKKILKGSLSNWRIDKKVVLVLLHDSWPMIFSGAFVLLYSRIDQIFIKHLIDARAVGIYDSAVRIAETWYFIPSIIIGSLFPAIVNAKETSDVLYYQRFKKLIRLIFIMTFSMALVTTLFAPLIIKLIYGEEFIDGVIILQIYVWTVISVSLVGVASNVLIIENFRKIMFFSHLIPMIANVILNLLWIPKFGIIGAAYATLFSYLLGPLSLLLFKQVRSRLSLIYK